MTSFSAVVPGQRTTLVTGTSKPYGVALVRACLERGDRVIAAARHPARVPILADLRAEHGRLEMLSLDPADAASVADAVPVLESLTSAIDCLLVAPAEPGVHERVTDAARDAHLDTLSGTGLLEHYHRSAIAPVLLVRTLLPLLTAARSARVMFVSSWLGSLAGKSQGGDYASCASAAGLHMLVRALSHDVAELGIRCMTGNPGWYATSPDGPAFRLDIMDSARGLLAVLDATTSEQSGLFFDHDGKEHAW